MILSKYIFLFYLFLLLSCKNSVNKINNINKDKPVVLCREDTNITNDLKLHYDYNVDRNRCNLLVMPLNNTANLIDSFYYNTNEYRTIPQFIIFLKNEIIMLQAFSYDYLNVYSYKINGRIVSKKVMKIENNCADCTVFYLPVMIDDSIWILRKEDSGYTVYLKNFIALPQNLEYIYLYDGSISFDKINKYKFQK